MIHDIDLSDPNLDFEYYGITGTEFIPLVIDTPEKAAAFERAFLEGEERKKNGTDKVDRTGIHFMTREVVRERIRKWKDSKEHESKL